MSDVMPTSDGQQASESDRTMLLICYVLHGVGFFSGGLAMIVGVILSHVKVGETSNEYIRSHHRWLIRTFWFGLLAYVISAVLVLILIGWLGILATTIWWIYRLVRGFLAYSERQPMPVS